MDAKDENGSEEVDITCNELLDKLEDCKEEFKSIMRINDSNDIDEYVSRSQSFCQDYSVKLANEMKAHLQIVKMDSNESKDLMSALETISDCYNSLNFHMATLALESNKKAIQRSKEGFVNQLSIFSIVLTVLTFVLNNAKLLSYETINFPLIMAGNVGFVLMSLVMFAMIYYFLHFDEGIHKKKNKFWQFVSVVSLLCLLIFVLTKMGVDLNTGNASQAATPTTTPIAVQIITTSTPITVQSVKPSTSPTVNPAISP